MYNALVARSMKVRIGAFNLNNLFSGYDFTAEVDELPPGARGLTGATAAAEFPIRRA